MFEAMDSLNESTISLMQYKEALKTLSLCTADKALKMMGME